MAVAVIRRHSFAKETAGWGATYTNLNAASIAAATTLVVASPGGAAFGSALITAGMAVFFLDSTGETRKVISAVAQNTPSAGLTTLTVPALAFPHVAGQLANNQPSVMIDYATTNALLFNTAQFKRKLSQFSPLPFTGTVAKNVGRYVGRIEADGTVEFDLRPSTNTPLIAKAVGQDKNVTGQTPGSVYTLLNGGTITLGGTVLAGTLAALTAVGATGFSATATYAVNDIVQFDTGTLAECRKITAITPGAPNIYVVDVAFTYAHANAAAIKRVVAPFVHSIPSRAGDLDAFVVEDYIPYDDSTKANGLTSNAYMYTGCKVNSAKFKANSTQGIAATLDINYQDKVTIDANLSIAVPNENIFVYDMEATLFDGTRYYRTIENTLDLMNDIKKVYSKKGDKRAFTIQGGLQEVKGTFKIYEDAVTQAYFFSRLNAATPISFTWNIQDPTTGYYYQVLAPRIVVDDAEDGSNAPADLIDMDINFSATLDAGASNVQLTLNIGSADYLPFT